MHVYYFLKKEKMCAKISTMGYLLYWKYTQYSEEVTNLSGKVKENLVTPTFPIVHSYVSLICEPNAIHGRVWILV